MEALSLQDRKVTPFLHGEFDENTGDFSPDGRWVAYESNESGRYEIYVQPFPGPGGKWQVSTNGGTAPVWRRDGKELFYVAPDRKLMAVPVKTGAVFEPETAAPLFESSPPKRSVPPLRRFGRRPALPREHAAGRRDLHADHARAELDCPAAPEQVGLAR